MPHRPRDRARRTARDRRAARQRRPLSPWIRAWATAAAALAGCAQFGVPHVPEHLAEPPWHPDGVYVAYLAETVVGFGHTAVIVVGPPDSDRWIRYEQLASAEVRYTARLRQSSARFWEVFTARLPSIFGLTREVVTRLEGEDPAVLLWGDEQLLPIPGLDAAAVRAAAEQRWRRAPALDTPTAPRYWWAFNNSQHFTRDVLSAGGPIHDRYFPKRFVEAYLEGPPPEVDGHRSSGAAVRRVPVVPARVPR